MSTCITLQDILADHPEHKRAGNGWLIRCPVHDDHNPSLSISEGDCGRVLVHCHAGCESADVLAALGIGGGGAAPSRPVAATQRKQAGKDTPKLWPTVEIAKGQHGKLVSVRCDGPARQFFQEQYGLNPDLFPDGWRVFEHPTLGAGIVYLPLQKNLWVTSGSGRSPSL